MWAPNLDHVKNGPNVVSKIKSSKILPHAWQIYGLKMVIIPPKLEHFLTKNTMINGTFYKFIFDRQHGPFSKLEN